MTETAVPNGQAAADPSGTTVNAPATGQGSSVGNGQTTIQGPDTGATDSFFDPASIQDKPELLAAYKQLQGSYTKRMQALAAEKQKIEAYDNFMRNPRQAAQQLAAQYGLQVIEPGQSAPQDQEFKSWDDVKQYMFKEFQKEMLNPLAAEVKTLKKQSIEMQLDSQFPDWRTYESEMMDVLHKHPTFVSDPAALYRMAVPDHVWEARATAKAMQKLKGATEHAQVSGGTTTKQTTQAPTGPLTFDQAVEVAKKRLAAEGRRAVG